MKPIRVNGRRVPCQICHRHDAKTDFAGYYLCGACFRAFALGLLIKRAME